MTRSAWTITAAGLALLMLGGCLADKRSPQDEGLPPIVDLSKVCFFKLDMLGNSEVHLSLASQTLFKTATLPSSSSRDWLRATAENLDCGVLLPFVLPPETEGGDR